MAVIGEIWGVLAVDGRLLRVLGRLGLRRSRRARLRHRAAAATAYISRVSPVYLRQISTCAIVLPSAFTSSSRSSSVRAAVFLIRAFGIGIGLGLGLGLGIGIGLGLGLG